MSHQNIFGNFVERPEKSSSQNSYFYRTMKGKQCSTRNLLVGEEHHWREATPGKWYKRGLPLRAFLKEKPFLIKSQPNRAFIVWFSNAEFLEPGDFRRNESVFSPAGDDTRQKVRIQSAGEIPALPAPKTKER